MQPRKFQFSARAVEQFQAASLPRVLALRAATATEPAEILIYDEIGYWGITATDFAAAFKAAGSGPVNIRINSPGGDVFDGLAIYNMILAHGNVTTFVDGLAASAASYIAMGGKTVNMAEASQLMIHNAWGLTVGNQADHIKQAAVLAKIDGQLADIYAAKTGKPAEDIAAMMAAETWLTAKEANADGFCDAVITPPKAENSAGEVFWSAKAGQRPKGALRNAFDPDGDGDDDAAEAVTLIQSAIGTLADAIETLTGTEPPDADDTNAKAKAVREKTLRLAKIR